MEKRVKWIGSLAIALILCLLCGLVPLFWNAPETASAATLNYDMNYVDRSMKTKYLNHWTTGGQGQRVSGETSGRWYFGYGDVSSTSYSFTQATFDGSLNYTPYTTGTPHQMTWGFNVSTKNYTYDKTQTMYVWTAENDGLVSFSGLAGKTSSTDWETQAGEQNDYDKCWFPDINTDDTSFDWVDGDSYTVSMWLVNSAGTSARNILEKTFTSEFVYLIPQDQIQVKSGEKIVFGYKCNTLNTLNDTRDDWKTQAIWALTSKFTAKDLSSQSAYTFEGTDINTYYTAHWSAQGNRVSGETNGTWKFGTGSASTSGYTFNAATQQSSTGTGDAKRYGADGTNQLSWGFMVSTSIGTASIYEMTAEKAGTFVFSGIIAKKTFEAGILAEAQNGYSSVSLMNANQADAKWHNGDIYKVGMYKVSGSTITAISENTFSSQYAWLVPQTPISLSAGDKIVFSLIATEWGPTGNTGESGTMIFLSSKESTPITYSVTTTNDTSKGTISGLNASYTAGSTVSATITAKDGYEISSVKWNNAEKLSGKVSTYPLSETISSNSTLVVTYVKKTYSVTTTNDTTKGTISGLNASYESGSNVSATITAKEGYEISSVKWNNTEKLSGNVSTYTLSATISSNSTLVVTYVAKAVTPTIYTLTVTNDSSQGTVSGNNASYTSGSAVSVTITAKDGYEISSVKWNNTEKLSGNVSTYALSETISSNSTLVITYVAKTVAPTTYTLTVTNDSSQGTVSGNSASYESGSTASVIITAKEGYEISSVKWNGTEKLTENVSTYTVNETVSSNSTLVITYVAKSSGGDSGSGSGSGSSGGSTDSGSGDGGTTVTKYKATVTITEKAGGNVKGIVNGSSYSGERTLTITAKEGYRIESVKIDGVEQKIKDDSSLTINVTFDADKTIEIVFASASAKQVNGWSCLTSLETVAPVGIILILGAAVMLIVKKSKREN